MSGDNMLIPGQDHLFAAPGEFPKSIILLVGMSGTGKTAYSMQFMRDGALNGDRCLYISCSPSFTEAQFYSYFANKAKHAPTFVSLFLENRTGNDGIENSSDLLKQISSSLSRIDQVEEATVRIVLDSLTDLIARYPNEPIPKFVAELYDLLKERNAIALITITGTPSATIVDTIGSLLDGIIQLRVEDSGDEVQRSMRLFSLKSIANVPKWIRFTIKQDGILQFGREEKKPQAGVVCQLCNGPIIGQVSKADSESPFHPHCLDTYRKLGEIYGSHILYALQPGVVNANFFFIDIVGLSNPLLSVEKQIGKIEDLNALIGSCEAYNKVPKNKKIVLPTGDGMAIGFLINPELPLQLGIQLHHKLHAYNEKAAADKALGVRIGISSGPVFVVSDINNNQNVWGPGIILARRVMDLGDNAHILLADNIAEALIILKDEYRHIIRPISNSYVVKHGQRLRIYSAYSEDFGNPAVPVRLTELD